jgi:predicted anti-sigma-YlaC factor YlaD
MNCKGILGSLTDYLHGETGKKVCGRLDEHLKGCKKCRMHVDSMKKIITLYQSWRDDAIPKDTSIRLKKVSAEEARKGEARKSRKKVQARTRKVSKARKRPARYISACVCLDSLSPRDDRV